MSKTIGRLLIASFVAFSINLNALQLRSDAPSEYTVKAGDTLWDISERFTDDPWMWPEIWLQNADIYDPHLIFPGDVLALVMVDGKPRVTVKSRSEAARTFKMTPQGTERLSPRIRVEPIANAIPTIPLNAVQGFLAKSRIVGTTELEVAPRILQGEDNRLLMGAGTKAYARGPIDEVANGYGIYKKGRLFKDPRTKEILGLEVQEVGYGSVLSEQNDIVTLMLERTNKNISIGDYLLEMLDTDVMTRFTPSSPEVPVSGEIMAVLDGVSQIGQFDVVAVNKGSREGLVPGSVFVVSKKGSVIYDRFAKEKVTLPDEEAGTLMLFDVHEKLSYGLIMKASKPLKVGDRISTPL